LRAKGSEIEFLKPLPEPAAAVNEIADTGGTIRKSIFMGHRPFQDSLWAYGDEPTWYHARREFVKDAMSPVARQFEFS